VGVTDTTIQRLMKPKSSADSTSGPLYLVFRVTDVSGNDSTIVRRVRIVSGPSVTVVRPAAGAVATPGRSVIVELKAADRDGVRTLGYNVTGAFTTTRSRAPESTKRDTIVWVDTLALPVGVTSGTFSISPFATDQLGQPGSGSGVTVTVQSLANDADGPLVRQTVRARLETVDSVSVLVSDPSGVKVVGVVLSRQTDGALISRDSIIFNGANIEEAPAVPLRLNATYVGERIVVRSFAYDTRGNIGYTMPVNAIRAPTTLATARSDTTLIVYGRTVRASRSPRREPWSSGVGTTVKPVRAVRAIAAMVGHRR